MLIEPEQIKFSGNWTWKNTKKKHVREKLMI